MEPERAPTKTETDTGPPPLLTLAERDDAVIQLLGSLNRRQVETFVQCLDEEQRMAFCSVYLSCKRFYESQRLLDHVKRRWFLSRAAFGLGTASAGMLVGWIAARMSTAPWLPYIVTTAIGLGLVLSVVARLRR